MSGSRISDMTNLPSLPASGATVPVVKTGDGTNYGYDLAADMTGRPTSAQLAADDGSSRVGFLQSGTGAVARSTQAKLRDTFSLKDFGAVGDGVTDDTTAIQAAINAVSALGGGTITGTVGSTYLFGTTLAVSLPAAVRIDLRGGILKPAVDRDCLTMVKDAAIERGTIDLSAVTGFSSNVVTVTSTATSDFGKGFSLKDVNIIGPDPGTTAAPTGTAIKLDVSALNNHHISFGSVDHCYITYFQNGVLANVPSPASGTNWANSNAVKGNTLFNDVVNAVKGVMPNASSGLSAWQFNYSVQARTTKSTLSRVLLWPGARAYGDIICYDLAGHTVDSKVIEFTSTSERANLAISGIDYSQIINKYTTYRPNIVNVYGNSTNSPSYRTTAPMSLGFPVGSGSQDDYLAYASTRSGWTITPSTAASAGAPNMFLPDSSFTKWTALNGDLTVKIDMGASVSKPQAIGLAFNDIPDQMKIETSTDDVTYTLLYDKMVTGCVGEAEMWLNNGSNLPARYIKITLHNDTAKDISIYRLWAQFASAKGNAFLAKYQPDVESQLSIAGTKVLGARATGWSADTGTAKKTATATYAKGYTSAYAAGTTLTYSATYVQAEQTAMATRMAAVEAALATIATAVVAAQAAQQDNSQAMKAVKDALIAHGLIGT